MTKSDLSRHERLRSGGRLSCREVLTTSVDDLSNLGLWRKLTAEILGTALVVFVGCGTCITTSSDRQPEDDARPSQTVVRISLAFGLAVATAVWATAHVSGGHVNPAVTMGMLATRRMSLAAAFLYVVAQMAGGILGASLLWAISTESHGGPMGLTMPAEGMTPAQAVGLEMMLSFILVFTVFASTDLRRRDLSGSKPLAIGLAVVACHLFAVPYTGASMNSARSFGPAVLLGQWDHQWIYWAGPISGGILAALLFELVFATDASIVRAKGCFSSKRNCPGSSNTEMINSRGEEDDSDVYRSQRRLFYLSSSLKDIREKEIDSRG